MTFRKGESGNPAGRRPGIPDRRTALRGLLEPHAKDLIQKAVDLALAGDLGALRLCIDRVLPALKPQDVPIELHLGENLSEAGEAALMAVGAGVLTPGQGAQVLQAIGALARVKELIELEERVKRLESNHANA